MPNKTTTTTTNEINFNLNAFLANQMNFNALRITEIKKLQGEIEIDENKNFERTLRISEHFKTALSYLNLESTKQELKHCNTKLTNDVLAELFGYSLAQFKRYKAVSKLDSETIKNYKEQTPKNKGLDSLIKFANAKDVTDTNEESEGNEESANEIEVKNDVNIKVDRKKNKLVWKGVATLDILDMIILEAQRQKAELIKLAEKK